MGHPGRGAPLLELEDTITALHSGLIGDKCGASYEPRA
jgi:hypothetical protein